MQSDHGPVFTLSATIPGKPYGADWFLKELGGSTLGYRSTEDSVRKLWSRDCGRTVEDIKFTSYVRKYHWSILVTGMF